MHKQVGHILRWVFELIILWAFVFPETGPWTAFTLTMITIGIEFDHFKPSDWRNS